MADWFWLRKRKIDDDTIVSGSHRPLSQSESGIAVITEQNDILPGERIELTPFRVATVFQSAADRNGFAPGLTEVDDGSFFFQASDKTFWLWTLADGFAPYTPVLSGGGGGGPEVPVNSLAVTITYDEAPTIYPIDNVTMYLAGVDQQSASWNGTGSRTITLHTDTGDTLGGSPGDPGTLFIVGKNADSDVWSYSIPFAALLRPTGTLAGAVAVTGETTITGVSGVFVGEEGTNVEALRTTRDVRFDFLFTNDAKTLLSGSPNQPYVAVVDVNGDTFTQNLVNPIDLVGGSVSVPGLPVGTITGDLTIMDSNNDPVSTLADTRGFTFLLTGEKPTAYAPQITSGTDEVGTGIVLAGNGITLL